MGLMSACTAISVWNSRAWAKATSTVWTYGARSLTLSARMKPLGCALRAKSIKPPRASMKVGSKNYIIHRSEEHTSELQSHLNLVCRLLLEKKNERKRGIQEGKAMRRIPCFQGLGMRRRENVARRRAWDRTTQLWGCTCRIGDSD